MVRQRQERAELRDAQEARRFKEIKARQARLPRGIKSVWARMTGHYQALVKEFGEEAKASKSRDRDEEQPLVDQHLAERRALEQELAQPDILAELKAVFEATVQTDPRQHLVLPPDDIPFTTQELLKQPELILDHISHKKARFKRTDILRELAKRISDPMALRTAADIAMNSVDLVKLDDGDNADFTTTDYLAAGNGLDACATTLSRQGGLAVRPTYTARAIQAQNAVMQKRFGGQLSDEQQEALHHILGDSQLSCVVGLAGSGKSTMLKTAQSAWAKQGITVHGAALAGKAAAGLQSASGIASRTLASLEVSWKNGFEPIARGDVLIVDEAGMVGTRQMTRIARKLQSIGAKLVLVGDPDQLQPIEAGTPFRRLIETHGTARLTEIHRQREEWQRHASRDLAEGRISDAVETYAQHGAVTNRWSCDTALAALVEDYISDVELNGTDTSRLAFAHRRKDVHSINQAIRGALRSSGSSEPEIFYDTETGPRAFAEGDRIVFTRNDKTMGVKNGMLGTVTNAQADQIVISLDSDGEHPAKVTINPNRYNAFDHGYAVTIHKSQGATVEQSYVLASRTMDAPLSYVAMTRHRENMKLYINEEDRPKWMASSPLRVPTINRSTRRRSLE